MDDKTKKLVLALTKALFGIYGVDCFIAGNNAKGIKRIIWTIIFFALSPLTFGASTIPLGIIGIYFL